MRFARMQYAPPAGAEHWQSELDRLAPRSEGSWLLLAWQPGDPWQPVHRWIIYQMHRPGTFPVMAMPSLLGPHPRVRGFYDSVSRVYRADYRCMVDRTQWELWQEYGCYAQPYWVIQGPGGGHKRRLSAGEKLVIRLKKNLPEFEMPAPGDLPYADCSAATIEQIAKREVYQQYATMAAIAEDRPNFFDGEELRTVDWAKDQLWKWLDQQVTGPIEELSDISWRKIVSQMSEADVPEVSVNRIRGYEDRQYQQFMQEERF